MPTFRFAAQATAAALGIAADRLRGTPRPFVVNHLVTVRCNLRCPFCYVSGPEQAEYNRAHYPSSSEMTTEEMKAFYRQLVAARFHIAVVLGGEPLLRTDFGELLQVLRGHLFTTVFSNGFLLEDRLDLVKPASAVFVSLDAPDEQHDQVRATPGSYRRAVAGLLAVRRRLPHVRAAINTTVTRANAHRVGEMLAFARDLGVPIAFQPPTFEGQFAVEGRPRAASSAEAADPEIVAEAFRTVRRAAARGEAVIGSRAFFDHVVENRPSYRCHYPRLALGPVLPNGDVVGCTHSRVIGNVQRSTVRELLASDAFQANAAAGPACAQGCRDWGIHDLAAPFERRFGVDDAKRYYRAFVREPRRWLAQSS